MTSTSETAETDPSLDDLLNAHFAGRVVRKDLTQLVKEGANVPVYVLEYLLGNYCASNDPVVIEDGLATVKRILAENYVRPDEAEKVKSTIRERGSLKVIDKATVKLNEKRDVYEALLSNLGTKGVEIGTETVRKYEKLLAGGIWSIITMHYFFEEGQKGSPFIIDSLNPIQMPNMDMDELFTGRRQFTEAQWIDVLLRSCGFDPTQFDDRAKWHLLCRLVPLVENNYNVCELGPEGNRKGAISTKKSVRTVSLSRGGKPPLQTCFTTLPAEPWGWSGSMIPDYSWNMLIRASNPAFSCGRSPVSLEALSIRLNRLENRTIEPVINRFPARGTVTRRQVDFPVRNPHRFGPFHEPDFSSVPYPGTQDTRASLCHNRFQSVAP